MQKPYNYINLEGKETLRHGDTLLSLNYITSMTTISCQGAVAVDMFQGELSKLLVQ